MIDAISELSVFFPAYNEEGNIEETVKKAKTALLKVAKKWEIIVVNDGSKDKTSEIAHRLEKSDKRIRVIDQENRGYGGAIATLTKSPGILLFVAYFFATIFPKAKSLATIKFEKWLKSLDLRKYPVLLIPLALVGVFYIYNIQFHNFFAYFNSGDNIHLLFPPFQIFNYSAPWVGTFWIEEVIFIYLFGAIGLMELIKEKQNAMSWFVGIFFTSILFVSHRDLMRYALPIVPFLIISMRKYLVTKEFRVVFLIIIIPTFLFALAFISNNVMPISNWGPLL